MKVRASDIFVFDFDGVICSSREDDIYHLPPLENETNFLELLSHKFELDCGHMEAKYQRHLLYQACCMHLGIPIERGIGFEKALEASRNSKFFVLTARSGWYAVERMRQFLTENDMTPIEIFSVGRVPKDRQIDIVCKEAEGRDVFYVEDNTSHLNAVESSSIVTYKKLRLVWARREAPSDKISLRTHVQEVFERVLESSVIRAT